MTGSIVGEVVAIRVDVGAPCSGVVAELPRSSGGQLSNLDAVSSGDTLVLVHPSPVPGVTPGGIEGQDVLPVQVTSPIAGSVLKIHRRKGQPVQAYEPIVTISGAEAKFILAYVPEHLFDAGSIEEGSSVDIQIQGSSGYAPSRVERVGVSLEQIPSHLLRYQDASQWGVPIRIELPKGYPLRPGSVVGIVLKPAG